MVPPQKQRVHLLRGDDLRTLAKNFAFVLEQNVEAINALNVFPVPDGDTGTNMLLTLRAVAEEVRDALGQPVNLIAASMAHGALLAARGNSGVILSQFFQGIAQGLANAQEINATDLVRAFREARAAAYRAVGNPVEGTILTVINDASEAASEAIQKRGADILDVWQAATQAAHDSVARTPELLSILKEAGVVDAGGQGLAIMLEAGLCQLRDEDITKIQVIDVNPNTQAMVREEFLAATETDLYGYCTQFMIEGESLDVDEIRTYMVSIAESTVVVGNHSRIRVHIHLEDPGPSLTYGVSQGTISKVNIESIDQQHQEFVATTRDKQQISDLKTPVEERHIAVVAIAVGQGLKDVLLNAGASIVMQGGQSMNPSTQDILAAVEEAPADIVIILPNNKNIVGTAEQAGQLSPKTVVVLNANTIPQGIAALLAFNQDRELEWNIDGMARALEDLKTGEVCQAVRSATVNGFSVQTGQIIALLENNLVAVGEDTTEVALELLHKAVDAESELVTAYWGELVNAREAENLASRIREVFPNIEVETIAGKQPYYHYILSVE